MANLRLAIAPTASPLIEKCLTSSSDRRIMRRRPLYRRTRQPTPPERSEKTPQKHRFLHHMLQHVGISIAGIADVLAM
jgi:hypothetical protein